MSPIPINRDIPLMYEHGLPFEWYNVKSRRFSETNFKLQVYPTGATVVWERDGPYWFSWTWLYENSCRAMRAIVSLLTKGVRP